MRIHRKYSPFDIINVIILSLLVFTTLYPFLNQLTLSLSTTKEAYSPGLHLFPKPGEMTIDPYRVVFRSRNIWIGFGNSVIRVVAGTLLALLVYGLSAYALSKPNFPGVKIFTFLFVFTMLFDGGVIPNYILIRKLGLMNTRLALIFQGVVSAFNIIIIRNFYKSIPESLEESAKIEGAGDITIFFRIILPLSKPVMATVGLWVAIWHWNNWFDAMLYITNQDKQVIQIILREILINNTGDMLSDVRKNQSIDFQLVQLRAAVIIISILPMMMLYPFLQRYFVKGIMLGSVKG
ncbi:MAG: carbohydrate ABC transporter permease [Spirochaetia bacterium]